MSKTKTATKTQTIPKALRAITAAAVRDVREGADYVSIIANAAIKWRGGDLTPQEAETFAEAYRADLIEQSPGLKNLDAKTQDRSVKSEVSRARVIARTAHLMPRVTQSVETFQAEWAKVAGRRVTIQEASMNLLGAVSRAHKSADPVQFDPTELEAHKRAHIAKVKKKAAEKNATSDEAKAAQAIVRAAKALMKAQGAEQPTDADAIAKLAAGMDLAKLLPAEPKKPSAGEQAAMARDPSEYLQWAVANLSQEELMAHGIVIAPTKPTSRAKRAKKGG